MLALQKKKIKKIKELEDLNIIVWAYKPLITFTISQYGPELKNLRFAIYVYKREHLKMLIVPTQYPVKFTFCLKFLQKKY